MDFVLDRLSKSKSMHTEAMAEIVRNATRISVPNVMEAILETKTEAAAAEITAALDTGSFDKATPHIEEFMRLRGIKAELLEEEGGSETRQGLDAKDLVERRKEKKNTFKLAPKALSDLVPGLMRQNHVGIFALPDSGKTAFCINFAFAMAKQGHKVLYISNEDALDSLEMRFLCRFNNAHTSWVEENQARATATANANGGKNLVLVSVPGGSIPEIEEMITAHKPDVLIVDQVRNLEIPGKDSLVQVLESAGREMRRFAKQYNLLSVSVTQAGDNATNVLALDRSHVDSSKIGFTATLDLLIGVGINDEFRRTQRRSLSVLGKNKISGKHDWVAVGIEEATCRFYSFGGDG